MSCEPVCADCERLRGAALGLVGEGGIEAVSHQSLAARTGLPPLDVALHYPSASDCVYETYDEVSAGVLLDMAGAFGEGESWGSGFELSRQRLLVRMAARPAEARLCFVEPMRGDRRLRRRRGANRRWILEFLQSEYDRRRERERLPEIQFELLIGAGFQAISSTVADGHAAELPELESQLADLAGMFGTRTG